MAEHPLPFDFAQGMLGRGSGCFACRGEALCARPPIEIPRSMSRKKKALNAIQGRVHATDQGAAPKVAVRPHMRQTLLIDFVFTKDETNRYAEFVSARFKSQDPMDGGPESVAETAGIWHGCRITDPRQSPIRSRHPQ